MSVYYVVISTAEHDLPVDDTETAETVLRPLGWKVDQAPTTPDETGCWMVETGVDIPPDSYMCFQVGDVILHLET